MQHTSNMVLLKVLNTVAFDTVCAWYVDVLIYVTSVHRCDVFRREKYHSLSTWTSARATQHTFQLRYELSNAIKAKSMRAACNLISWLFYAFKRTYKCPIHSYLYHTHEQSMRTPSNYTLFSGYLILLVFPEKKMKLFSKESFVHLRFIQPFLP